MTWGFALCVGVRLPRGPLADTCHGAAHKGHGMGRPSKPASFPLSAPAARAQAPAAQNPPRAAPAPLAPARGVAPLQLREAPRTPPTLRPRELRHDVTRHDVTGTLRHATTARHHPRQHSCAQKARYGTGPARRCAIPPASDVARSHPAPPPRGLCRSHREPRRAAPPPAPPPGCASPRALPGRDALPGPAGGCRSAPRLYGHGPPGVGSAELAGRPSPAGEVGAAPRRDLCGMEGPTGRGL